MHGRQPRDLGRACPAIPARPGKAASGAAKAIAERVDPKTQRSRDDTRRKILQEELDAAQKRLAEAQQKLAEQEAVRSGEEKVYPQRVLDRLKPYQDEVERQEKNVALAEARTVEPALAAGPFARIRSQPLSTRKPACRLPARLLMVRPVFVR